MKPMNRILTSLALASWVTGCATALPPQELKDARAAYKGAQEGPAGELAPAKLDSARQALEDAEKAFRDAPEGPAVKDAAYVAHRRAIVADEAGILESEVRRKKRFEKQYAKLERERLNMTQAELEAARKLIDEEKRRAEQAAHEAKLTKQQAAEKLAQQEKMTAAQLAQRDKEIAARDKALAEERAKLASVEGKLQAAVASLAKMANVKEEARGVVITLSGSVLFATGQHELLPIAKDKLNDVAKALKDQGFKKVIIEGHTDSRGSESNNEALSLKRANAVRTHLVSQGLAAKKIHAMGLGESRPVATNDTTEGRANNRRVELVVTPE